MYNSVLERANNQVAALLNAYDIEVREMGPDGPCAHLTERWIAIPNRIHNLDNYAAALHEIGHLKGPHQDMYVEWASNRLWVCESRANEFLLMGEYGAWVWAHKAAIIWNDELNKIFKSSLTGYHVAYDIPGVNLPSIYFEHIEDGFVTK